jgi:hypothetical protein
MTDLNKLTVSLTKHGAHKVAALLKKYDANEVLNHLEDSEPGINIESAQAKKTLSANDQGSVPALWKEAQQQGSETIDALVLIAIIFSHHELISAMQGSSGKRQFSGTINRGVHIDGKAFTNLAHIIEEFGYSTEHSVDHISYDLHKLFHIKELNKLVRKILALKLEAAGWDKKNSVTDESIALEFHKVFSVTEENLKAWLTTGELSELKEPQEETEDLAFFFKGDDKPSSLPFNFQAGHNRKKTGAVKVTPSKKESTAILLHNEIQNALYIKLVEEFGKDSVGTEVSTGEGTSIDVVVKTDKFCWFYEIKTAPSVRACLRQAIPQLLEYAYWHGKDDRADRLIIVSPLPITKEAETYLNFLRENFQLKVYYQKYQSDMNKD